LVRRAVEAQLAIEGLSDELRGELPDELGAELLREPGGRAP
jgi:hypothetical protein